MATPSPSKARIWELVHAERAALIEDLSAVPAADWATPSLCEGWSVHDVAGHLVGNAQTRLRTIPGGMLRARFDFDKMVQHEMESQRGATPAEALASLRRVAGLTVTPPVTLTSRLVEEVVHGEDIRRPLGLTRAYPAEAVTGAIGYQLNASDKIGGAKQRLGSVQLQATDTDFTHGSGPVVSGPALELLLLAAGRTTAVRDVDGLDHLSGS